MLDAKGTAKGIKSVACLNIYRNYFKHKKTKKITMQETSMIYEMLLWILKLLFKVTLFFRKNNKVSQITE